MGLQGWLKPPFGTIKVNCDGGWCSRTGRGGFGWVARDFAGIFKGAGGVGNIMCVSSVMAEAEAVRLALLWCVEGGFALETDSQVLVDMIRGSLRPEAVLDDILWDIVLLKQQLCAVEFLYAPRSSNEAAHLMASYVMHVGDPIWLLHA
ncbi:ribonuclease H protein [Pyrus ussuriensis x Pyrus communis]|uniref:Ribonuclease H protein n=1 Tax=Pyrus ussuriensis x Pyrus communis TaxID=2448454 RepID=A0A5N5FRE7_9ROSA|nr:ribonuclease H protein [Pyrus ussuriensis x Pyrus communis]